MVGDKGKWQLWIEASARTDGVREIARKIEQSHSTLSRKYSKPDVEFTRLVARTFNASLLDGLLAAGILNEEDIDHIKVDLTLRAAEDLELAREVYRRMAGGREVHPALIEPLSGDTSLG